MHGREKARKKNCVGESKSESCVPEPHVEARPTVEPKLRDALDEDVGPFHNGASVLLTGIRKRGIEHGLVVHPPVHQNHYDLLQCTQYPNM